MSIQLASQAIMSIQLASQATTQQPDGIRPRDSARPTSRTSSSPWNPPHPEPIAAARELTHGRMVDVAFEVTGLGPLIASEFQVVRAGGRFVILSTPRSSPTSFDFCDVNELSASIIVNSHPPPGSTFEQWTHSRHAELFVELVDAGALVVSDLTTDRPRYSEAPDTYVRLLEDRSRSPAMVFSWDD
jgi:threonine dehydrogenase-like Zn-dependent dehydrogenase